MKINVKHIADLSRISLTKKELEKFTPQMESILESVSVLQEVDTTNVEAMKGHIPLSKIREDIPQKGLSQEDVLKNAKYTESGCIKVYGEVFGAGEES